MALHQPRPIFSGIEAQKFVENKLLLVRFVEGLELALQVAGGKYEAGLLFSDVAFALQVQEILFFTQSEVIVSVSPQPAQLGIHFLLLSQHTVRDAPP